MKKLFSISVFIILFSLFCVHASAGVPQEINYQGKLTDANGGLIVSDNVDIEFNVYTDSTGGTSLWSETHYDVPVKNGLFSVVLGSETAIPDSVFSGDTRYLGITVETDPEVTPRVPTVSVGYAFHAGLADTAEYARASAAPQDDDWTISGNNIYRTQGNVGIGTMIPVTKLDVRGTVNVGADDVGYDVNFYGAESGSRMFWDESKMAFRVGRVWGTEWDDQNVGKYSFANAYQSKASGWGSSALGSFLDASGDNATAIGYASTASGIHSMALGCRVDATAQSAFVIGSSDTQYPVLVNNIPKSLMIGFNSTTPTLFVDGTSVGIGTTDPSYKLDVDGAIGATTYHGDGSNLTGISAGQWTDAGTYIHANNATDVVVTDDGKVGIGITDPGAKLGIKAEADGKVLKGYNQFGSVIVEIGEGLDYSEAFPTAQDDVNPGMVMVIDPVNVGNLAVSTGAYDSKVAGIVAGAKGLGSGVRLGTRNAGSGDHAVALAGRVYCSVDTRYGDIMPGDLLTTSPTPGHAMVVKDHSKAQGAILGKAMEGLSGGEKGQILVLVTLQ